MSSPTEQPPGPERQDAPQREEWEVGTAITMRVVALAAAAGSLALWAAAIVAVTNADEINKGVCLAFMASCAIATAHYGYRLSDRMRHRNRDRAE